MRVLIACEYSGIERDAFIAKGHDAWSCDIIPTERPGPHIINDVRNVLCDGWDMMIAHPPCQFLSRAGARWKSPERDRAAYDALLFFLRLWEAPIPAIAVENPIGKLWQWFRKPDQVIQPFHFGHIEMKSTCLWLKNLPPLMATVVIDRPFVNWTEHGHRRAADRSRSFRGIAEAMANQWG